MAASEEKLADGKILLRREGAIATIVFNHPERMNSLELEMWTALARVIPELGADDSVRVLVFRGAGERAFSAGADISPFEKERLSSPQAEKDSDFFLAGHHAPVSPADHNTRPAIGL